MAMNIRCKMVCVSITDFGFMRTVKFQAQYDPLCPDDMQYSEATPSGDISLNITNEKAFNAYEVGKKYYFTSEKAEAE